MNRYFLQRREYRILLSIFLFVGLLMAFAPDAKAQNRPAAPVISLTGAYDGWDQNWFPDGRITFSPSRNLDNPREVLVPVFIENRWFYYENSAPQYIVDPIKSFKFTVLYDSTYLRAVGYQKTHPQFGEDDPRLDYDFQTGELIEPLAKNFNVVWFDEPNSEYKEIFEPEYEYSPNEKRRGRGITITGTSTVPMPNTDVNAVGDFQVLLYLKFEVRTTQSATTPLIISLESIMYNDLDVRKNAPFEEMRPYDSQVETHYSDPTRFTGVAGVNNEAYTKFNTYPQFPGVIYAKITGALPSFDFTLQSYFTGTEGIREETPSLFEIVEPLTIDSTEILPNYAEAEIRVMNDVSETRLQNVRISSDSEWLYFNTYSTGGSRSPCPGRTHDCYIDWIDNGTITSPEGDPYGEVPEPEGDVYIRISCDPSEIQEEEEKTGIYVGYITFDSDDAEFEPVRLKVTFMYLRSPFDGLLEDVPGINLDLVNGNGETINLIFGVGHRATHGVDPLYGEFAYQYPLSTNDFDARWYPKDDDGTNIVPFGLGDMAPNALNPRSNSRDIRNYYATSHSLAYYCEFNAVQYPLTIEWDINDFTILLPDGTQEEPTLYIRDIVNGVPQQGTNMRNATRTGATTFAYTISDPRVTSFLIEYTLPQVVEYLDELGNPIIKDGWNLLSMPVLPVNTEWDQVFPLATNKPWRFYNNNYQQEEVLKPGQGYFVKYEDVVDTRFKGATLVNISPDMGYNIRLTGGWNTIGALSIPMSINDIDFEPFQPGIVPDIDEALAKGVYEYRTDQGYFEVSQLVPGLGYWLYANQQGYLALRAQKFNAAQDQSNIRKETVLAQSVKIDLNDNAQHSKSLYLTENNRVDLGNFEYPPVPPMELFDVRFSNNGYLEMAGEATMMLQGVEYPISIAMQNPDAVYTLTDAVTGEVFGQITEDNNVIEIEKVKSDRIKIEKADAEGFEFKAYPNPASSFANVMFSVPESGNVNIALYDAIGNKVMTIADAQFDAGSHSASINAADLSAGNYILRITAGNNTAVTKITIIK